jgi:hypothetical protein
VRASVLSPRRSKTERPPEWNGAEGYHAGGTEGLKESARPGYLQVLERLRGSLPQVQPNTAFWNAMSGLVEEVRHAGAEPVFAIAPTLNERENISGVPGGAAFIPLNDPNTYAALYDPELHYDGWHLNDRGAHDFTRILAEQFVAKTGAGKK